MVVFAYLESAKIAEQARAENRSMKEIALQKLLKPEEMEKKLAQKLLDENKPGLFCSLFEFFKAVWTDAEVVSYISFAVFAHLSMCRRRWTICHSLIKLRRSSRPRWLNRRSVAVW